MKTAALTVAGIIFAVVAVAHFYRYHKAMTIMLSDFSVPLDWSLYGGIVSVILALWMFIAAKRDH